MNCLCFLPRLTISALDPIPLVLLRTSRPFPYNFHPNFALLISPSLLGHVHQNTNLVNYLPSCKKIKNAPGTHIPITLVFFGIVKVKVAQSCPILCNPMDYTIHGIVQARILERWPFPSLGDLPNPGKNPGLPHCRQILYLLSHQRSPSLVKKKKKKLPQRVSVLTISPQVTLTFFHSYQQFLSCQLQSQFLTLILFVSLIACES